MCVKNCSGERKFSNFTDNTCYETCLTGKYETVYTNLNQLNQTVTYKCVDSCPSNKPREVQLNGSIECDYVCAAPQIFTQTNGSCTSQCEIEQGVSASRKCVDQCEDA